MTAPQNNAFCKLPHKNTAWHSSRLKQYGGLIRVSVMASAAVWLAACASTAVPPSSNKPQIQTTTSKPVRQNPVRQTAAPKQANVYHGDHHDHDHASLHTMGADVGTRAHFTAWLSARPHQAAEVAGYERYLTSRVGTGKVPPMHELLTTARSWQACGHEPYEVPPRALWDAMIPTIMLFNDLKARGVLPAGTHIRSVYRSPELNRCAGGAVSSKHMTNGAMDIWVPSIDMGSHEMFNLQNRLCEYWLYEGRGRDFGLGLYATGAIHLDTQGYRKWGAQFSESHSICRISPPKQENL